MPVRNTHTVTRSLVLVLAATGFSIATLAADPPPSAATTSLPGVLVQGKKDAFADSDRRLAALRANLPLLGSDLKPQTSFVDRAAAYYDAHRDPNNLDVEQQILLLQLMGADLRMPNVAAP